MRAASFVLAFALALVPASIASAAGAKALPASVELQALAGGKIQRADLDGKPVVLQFFADWCKGCGDVMGQLSPVVAEVAGARFLPVSVDESISDARAYFARQRAAVKPLERTAAFDKDAKLATALGIQALPALVVVDGQGKVLYSASGHPDAAQVQKIRKLIGGGAK